MKIFMLMASERVSGAAEPVVDLCRDLERVGHQVTFACMTSYKSVQPLADFAFESGLAVTTDFSLPRKFNPLGLINDVRKLAKVLSQGHYDILHSHYSTDHWIGALAARMVNSTVKVLRSRHHSAPERHDLLHRYLYQSLTDHVIEICAGTLEQDAANLQLPQEKFTVVHGAVDASVYAPSVEPVDVAGEFGWPADAFVLGYAARLVPKRRHEWLLNAMPEVLNRCPKARLLLIGRGTAKSDLRKRIEELGLQAYVGITGYREDFIRVLRALDLHVFIREGTDGACRALLQSCAMGIPAVTGDAGALPEIVKHGETGLVTNASEPSYLAEAIVTLIENEPLRRRLGEQSRVKMCEKFSRERRLNDVVCVYEKLKHDHNR